MRSRSFFIVFIAVGIVLTGCGSDSWFSKNPKTLPVETIRFDTPNGPARFNVEIASTAPEQELGLMYRREMAPNDGMLFDLHQPQFLAFWMKNTYLSLDLIFVRADGTISSVEPNAIPFSTDTIRSKEPVQVVIELNGGRAHQLGIVPGERVHASVFGNL
jgi:uncharacterized membrane protein (UPF0127 family)